MIIKSLRLAVMICATRSYTDNLWPAQPTALKINTEIITENENNSTQAPHAAVSHKAVYAELCITTKRHFHLTNIANWSYLLNLSGTDCIVILLSWNTPAWRHLAASADDSGSAHFHLDVPHRTLPLTALYRVQRLQRDCKAAYSWQ